MAKKKQLSIEQRARIDILAAEKFPQQSIAKKLGISKFGVQYSLQRKTETGVNEDRKRMKIQGVDLNDLKMTLNKQCSKRFWITWITVHYDVEQISLYD